MSDPIKEKLPDFTVVDKLPPPEAREPGHLYIVQTHEMRDERDRVIGSFIDAWNGIESGIAFLLWKLMNVPYPIAEAVFFSSMNIRTNLDMITSLMTHHHIDSRPDWVELRSEILTLSNNRNHIVHGRWRLEVNVQRDNDFKPSRIDSVEWTRVYLQGDPQKNETATVKPKNSEKGGENRYSIERISRKTLELQRFREHLTSFIDKLYS